MIDRDEYAVRLVDLPAGVGGFITESSDGFLNIYLNARHGWKGQRRSLRHEMRHAEADDLRSSEPLAVIEARADQKPSPSRAREACAIPCLKEGGSAPALSDEVAAQKPSPLGKVARPVAGSDEVAARLASIPNLILARDLVPQSLLPSPPPNLPQLTPNSHPTLTQLTPRQLAIIRRALMELDNCFLTEPYDF